MIMRSLGLILLCLHWVSSRRLDINYEKEDIHTSHGDDARFVDLQRQGRSSFEAPASKAVPFDKGLASHALHMSSTVSNSILERKREGTLKGNKEKKGNKGSKSKESPKGRTSKGKTKGEKNSKSKEGKGTTSAPSITPGPTIIEDPTRNPSTSLSLSDSPSGFPSPAPSKQLTDVTAQGSASDALSPTPSVSRLIPAFQIGYTIRQATYSTSQAATPTADDYLGLAEATHAFLYASFDAYFANIENVKFLGSHMEYYYQVSVYVIEYQFKTDWETGLSVVPSIPELNLIVGQLFSERSIPAYIKHLGSALPATNVFSLTKTATLGDPKRPSNEEEKEEDETAAASEAAPESDPSGHSTVKIVVPIAAVASVCGVLFFFFFLKRKKEQQVDGSEVVESDAKSTEDVTLDTTPIISPHGDLVDDHSEDDHIGTPTEVVTRARRKSRKRRGLFSSPPIEEGLEEVPLADV